MKLLLAEDQPPTKEAGKHVDRVRGVLYDRDMRVPSEVALDQAK
jgi:hypothetical protein